MSHAASASDPSSVVDKHHNSTAFAFYTLLDISVRLNCLKSRQRDAGFENVLLQPRLGETHEPTFTNFQICQHFNLIHLVSERSHIPR